MTHPSIPLLGVNVDHVATLRQQRGTSYPDPVLAALAAEQAGADGITVHLREDRRHIQMRDVERLLEATQTRVNLEMAATDAMVELACDYRPRCICLVPERREELTTEGGLDVAGQRARLTEVVGRLSAQGMEVSLFIEPNSIQIEAAVAVGAPVIELHTGVYAEAKDALARMRELQRLTEAARHAASLGLKVNAGHGLHYHNVTAIARLPEIYELNIGHAIVAQAIFSGIGQAVRDMKQRLRESRA
jgi:pyridoxine 5-phosphate synthase